MACEVPSETNGSCNIEFNSYWTEQYGNKISKPRSPEKIQGYLKQKYGHKYQNERSYVTSTQPPKFYTACDIPYELSEHCNIEFNSYWTENILPERSETTV